MHRQQASDALDEGVAPCLWLRAIPPRRYEWPPEALGIAEREWAGASGAPRQENVVLYADGSGGRRTDELTRAAWGAAVGHGAGSAEQGLTPPRVA